MGMVSFLVSTIEPMPCHLHQRNFKPAIMATSMGDALGAHALTMPVASAVQLVETTETLDGLPVVVLDEQAVRWHGGLAPFEQVWRFFPCWQQELEFKYNGHARKGSLAAIRQLTKSMDASYVELTSMDLMPPNLLPAFLSSPGACFLSAFSSAITDQNMTNQIRQLLRPRLVLRKGPVTSVPQLAPHGLGTWISCQQGQVGIGWLMYDTQRELDAWAAEPHRLDRGEWRHHILKQHEAVYLDPGMVFFTFSITGSDESIYAVGHGLRRMGIAEWSGTLCEQARMLLKQNGTSTARAASSAVEELIPSKAMLDTALAVVESAEVEGRLQMYGSNSNVELFRTNASKALTRIEELQGKVGGVKGEQDPGNGTKAGGSPDERSRSEVNHGIGHERGEITEQTPVRSATNASAKPQGRMLEGSPDTLDGDRQKSENAAQSRNASPSSHMLRPTPDLDLEPGTVHRSGRSTRNKRPRYYVDGPLEELKKLLGEKPQKRKRAHKPSGFKRATSSPASPTDSTRADTPTPFNAHEIRPVKSRLALRTPVTTSGTGELEEIEAGYE